MKQWILRSFHLLNVEESEERFSDHDQDSDGSVSWKEYMLPKHVTHISPDSGRYIAQAVLGLLNISHNLGTHLGFSSSTTTQQNESSVRNRLFSFSAAER